MLPLGSMTAVPLLPPAISLPPGPVISPALPPWIATPPLGPVYAQAFLPPEADQPPGPVIERLLPPR
jgi:hypothetical protein